MTGPEVTIVHVLQCVAIGLAIYLAVVTALTVAARVTGLQLLRGAVDLITPAVVGVLLGLPAAAVAQTATTDPPVVMHRLPDAAEQPPPPPVPHVVEEPATWTITPGQHFWAVAEHVLRDALHREPTDAEVVPYWRELIAANRDRLRDRDNPDLVFPGQVFVLPAVN